LFQYLIYRSDVSIIEKINHNNYKTADLVEVKLPVHLHIQDWNEYEVISGQVKLNGNNYNYAELKLTRDTMYLLCIPNHNKWRLMNAKVVYAKQVNDVPVNKKPQFPVIKKYLSDYNYNAGRAGNNSITCENVKCKPDYSFAALVKTLIHINGRPPELTQLFS